MAVPAEWPNTLKEAHGVFVCELDECAKRGIVDPQQVSTRLVGAFSAHFGGTELYVPKNTAEAQSERDAEIWGKFNGRNTRALAQSYGLSERTIERILERERKARQGSLFDAPTREPGHEG